MNRVVFTLALLSFGVIGGSRWASAEEAIEFKLTDDWQVQLYVKGTMGKPDVSESFQVSPPQLFTVTAERHESLPLFNPNGPEYAKGARLVALRSEHQTSPDLLDPASVVVRAGPEETDEQFMRGQDFEFEDRWGGIGQLPDGKIKEGQPVFISYQHVLPRIDSLVLTSQGKIEYRAGKPRAETPHAPELSNGEKRLANLWIASRMDRLTENHLFPILEAEYPEPAPVTPSIAEQQIPRAMAKLRSGEPLKILAWGDSVTEGAYIADLDHDRWQAQFLARLQARFPQAKIELVTEAWGGRNTSSYLGVPPGEPHNYKETVLGAKPDLIISEFVNDAGLDPSGVEERYSQLLKDFQEIGAEWIILTPHYVRPDWMGLDRQRDIDDDPRPYVKGLREFSKKHDVALADASLRYGRLWRMGIPYNTLMVNCINHPDPRGMKLFADALMELFPQK